MVNTNIKHALGRVECSNGRRKKDKLWLTHGKRASQELVISSSKTENQAWNAKNLPSVDDSFASSLAQHEASISGRCRLRRSLSLARNQITLH